MQIRIQEDFLNADPCGSGSATLIKGKRKSTGTSAINQQQNTILPRAGLSLASISVVMAVPVRDLGRPWNRDKASGLNTQHIRQAQYTVHTWHTNITLLTDMDPPSPFSERMRKKEEKTGRRKTSVVANKIWKLVNYCIWINNISTELKSGLWIRSFSQCGPGSSCFLNADPDPAWKNLQKITLWRVFLS